MSIKPLAMRDVLLDRVWRAMEEDQKIFFVRYNENTQVMFGPGVIDLRDGDISDDGLVEASVFSRNNGY